MSKFRDELIPKDKKISVRMSDLDLKQLDALVKYYSTSRMDMMRLLIKERFETLIDKDEADGR